MNTLITQNLNIGNLLGTFSDWFGKGSFYGPTFFDSGFKSFVRNINSFSPFRRAKRETLVFKDSIIAFVSTIFLAGRPFAVFFAVVAVSIDSVNLCLFFSKLVHMFKVAGKHVLFKLFGRRPKAFNPTSTVVWVLGQFVRCASRSYTVIDSIKSRGLCSFHIFICKNRHTLEQYVSISALKLITSKV